MNGRLTLNVRGSESLHVASTGLKLVSLSFAFNNLPKRNNIWRNCEKLERRVVKIWNVESVSIVAYHPKKYPSSNIYRVRFFTE